MKPTSYELALWREGRRLEAVKAHRTRTRSTLIAAMEAIRDAAEREAAWWYVWRPSWRHRNRWTKVARRRSREAALAYAGSQMGNNSCAAGEPYVVTNGAAPNCEV